MDDLSAESVCSDVLCVCGEFVEELELSLLSLFLIEGFLIEGGFVFERLKRELEM